MDAVVVDVAAALLVATVFEVFGDVIPAGCDFVEDFCFVDVVAGEAPVVGGEDLGESGPLHGERDLSTADGA